MLHLYFLKKLRKIYRRANVYINIKSRCNFRRGIWLVLCLHAEGMELKKRKRAHENQVLWHLNWQCALWHGSMLLVYRSNVISHIMTIHVLVLFLTCISFCRGISVFSYWSFLNDCYLLHPFPLTKAGSFGFICMLASAACVGAKEEELRSSKEEQFVFLSCCVSSCTSFFTYSSVSECPLVTWDLTAVFIYSFINVRLLSYKLRSYCYYLFL